jgi:hypothetical protein
VSADKISGSVLAVEPDDAQVVVLYNDQWYWIDRTDYDSKSQFTFLISGLLFFGLVSGCHLPFFSETTWSSEVP